MAENEIINTQSEAQESSPALEQNTNVEQGLKVRWYNINNMDVQEYLEKYITKRYACYLADIFARTDINDEEDIAETFELLNIKFYRSPLKYSILNAFERYVNENSRKYRISIEKKAISTHLRKWTGWRHDAYRNKPYCTSLYGGYVLCCVFEGVQ